MSNTKQGKIDSDLTYAILSKHALLDRLNSDDPTKKIIVTPLLDPDIQIGSCSIDIRLGCDFVIFKKAKFSDLNPLEKNVESIGQYMEKMYVCIGDRFFLHPREFILGMTLEYVKLPPDISAYITSRSTWGRLGLVIATATAIHPNYAGVITLELSNLGEAPIPLYPGIRVAQLIFHKTERQIQGDVSSYHLSVKPSFAKILEEPEWEIIEKLSKK